MRILIAVDGTECSKAALKSLMNRSWNSKDEFMLVSVVEPLDQLYEFDDVEEQKKYLEDVNASCKKITSDGAKKLASKLGSKNVKSEVLYGLPAEQIVQFAADWLAELIVIGSHGHSGCRRFMPGSVAEAVVKQSPCTVEVVKDRQVHR